MSKIKELLDDIRKVRNDLVAQANPHFQSLTNIIYKWETKLATESSTCTCGRSPTGSCIAWHKLTEEQYKKSLEHYNKHTPAIDGPGE